MILGIWSFVIELTIERVRLKNALSWLKILESTFRHVNNGLVTLIGDICIENESNDELK